jgi:hypothetical protein
LIDDCPFPGSLDGAFYRCSFFPFPNIELKAHFGVQLVLPQTNKRSFGIQVITLGLDQPWKGGDMNFQGGGYKINLLKDALEPYKNDENRLVMFTDR